LGRWMSVHSQQGTLDPRVGTSGRYTSNDPKLDAEQ
jgi:hypothetical protein